MKKILIPIAFTANTDALLRYALELARKFQADITLLHVVGNHDILSAVDSGHENDSIEDLKNAAIQKIKELDAFFPAPLNVDFKVAVGFPGEVIPEVAKEIAADLILVPHRHDAEGVHPLSPIVVETLRQATCPVLIVPSDLQFSPPKHIFFAFDMDSQLPEELETLKEWLSGFAKQLHGVHILHKTESRELASQQLETLVFLSPEKVDFTLSEGPWRNKIEELSLLDGADFLAVAPPHRNGLGGWLDFRALRLLVNEMPIPVLVCGAH